MNQGRKNAGEGLLFPKTQMKKKRIRHPKSILQNKETRTCFLCMKLHDDYSVYPILHEHHIFEGTGKRQKSEEYGLKVYLCPGHHMYSEEDTYEDGGLCIRLAESAAEIVMEGRLLHHCVGGDNYLSKHNRGDSYILMLRTREEPEIPYITVEIRNNQILQWYGEYDKKPNRERIEAWLTGYIENLNRKHLKIAV